MNVNAALRLLQAGALSFLLLSTHAAVIEVTAGGKVSEPTYMFSDASGNALATLVGNSTALSASADLVTGNGNSVDELATAMASLQATIAQLNATVAQLDAKVNSSATRLELAEATIASLQTALAAKLDATTAATTYQPILAGGSTESGCVYNRQWYVTAAAVHNALTGCGCTNNNGHPSDGGGFCVNG